MKKVNVNVLIKYLIENYNVDDCEISVDDFKDGGVYGIFIGSRDIIDDVFKVEGELVLKSKEEIIKGLLFDEDEDESEYYEEFCDSGEIDWNDFGGLYENLNEEERIEYYNVEL